MGKSRLMTATMGAVLAVTTGPSLGATPRPGAHDHVLVVVTAGDRGATGFSVTLGGPRKRTETGPGVFGLGLGHSKHGGGIFAVEQGGGPLEITTTKQLGSQRLRVTETSTRSTTGAFQVQFDVGELRAGESALGIAVLGNARFASLRLPRHSLKAGSVRVQLIQLGGTRVVRVGDTAAEGAAVMAVTAGGGSQSSSSRFTTGIAGGFVTSGVNLSSAAWSAPDGKTGRWVSGVASGVGGLSFAGPAGVWSFSWSGADAVAAGSPVAWFTTPVGAYWRYLRCHECSPDAVPPVGVDVHPAPAVPRKA